MPPTSSVFRGPLLNSLSCNDRSRQNAPTFTDRRRPTSTSRAPSPRTGCRRAGARCRWSCRGLGRSRSRSRRRRRGRSPTSGDNLTQCRVKCGTADDSCGSKRRPVGPRHSAARTTPVHVVAIVRHAMAGRLMARPYGRTTREVVKQSTPNLSRHGAEVGLVLLSSGRLGRPDHRR